MCCGLSTPAQSARLIRNPVSGLIDRSLTCRLKPERCELPSCYVHACAFRRSTTHVVSDE